MTNAVRHSGGRQCRVRLTTSGDELVLEVHDDGRSPQPWTPGVGLAAMRERAAELGGTVHAGPAGPGGATVIARLPLPRGGE